ncbi:NACHT domain-containing protein [Lentzea sp. NPDC004789]
MGKHLRTIIAALLPPAAAFTVLQAWATAHPWWAFAALLAWQVFVWSFAFVSKLVGGTADELNARWKGPLAKWIDEWVRHRLSGFERRYRQSVQNSVRFVDLKGLATMGFYTPQLDEVFVDVSLVHSDPVKVPSGVLGQQHVEPDRRFIGDLIDKPDPVVLAVIGAPGCGKTTLLKHTALLVCRTRRRRRRVPVLLYLRDHIQAIAQNTPLPEMIHRRASAGWFEQKLDAGSCVVLLDGLDEVADLENRREVADWVERQVACYPLNDFVITSRPHGYQTAPISGADVVQVRGFSDQQVTRFAHGWYLAFEQRSTGEKSAAVAKRAAAEADDLLKRLHHNPALYELTVNPLLLTMIANVHKFRGALPGSRVDLYSEICQVLLWRRQEAKKLSSELTADQKMMLLSGLAFVMMSRHVRDLSSEQVKTEFRSFLRRTARGIDEDEVLTDMTSSGLLVERERDLFAFAHLTFQEYLAAHHIREKQLTKALVDNVDDVWWRETTLLHVARVNADPIVQACLDSATVRALSLAFDCSEHSSELAPELRAELDQLLETVFDEKQNTSLRSLMIHVVVSRHLRNVVRTGEGTRLCTEPVTRRIYQLFLESHPRHWPDGSLGTPDEPVCGVRRADAQAFAEWVNSSDSFERIVRLPSNVELESWPMRAKLGQLVPWASDRRLPALSDPRSYMVSAELLDKDLAHDLLVLPAVVESAELFMRTKDLPNGSVHLPPQSGLRVLKLGAATKTWAGPTTIGHALVKAVERSAESTKSTFGDRFRFAFIKVVGSRDEHYQVPPDWIPELIDRAGQAPMTDWGNASLTEFATLADAVFSGEEPLTPEIASELRIAAMCLSLETDDDDQAMRFRFIAAGVSYLQRRISGAIPPIETIVLAMD